MKFRGKTAVITGAGHGIGGEIAKAFASEGANAVIADINTESGKLTETEILKSGRSAFFTLADAGSPGAAEKLMRAAEDKYGRIDILINNAGISKRTPLYSLSIEEWHRIIDTNLGSVFFCSCEAAKIMKKSDGGCIINIASTRAFMSKPGSEAYAASKGGIVSLTHALAASLAPDRIRVNSISPGWIETGDYSILTESDHLQHFAGRVGRPQDIAGMCLFLASEENSFIDGVNIIIDGGMTRKMIYE